MRESEEAKRRGGDREYGGRVVAAVNGVHEAWGGSDGRTVRGGAHPYYMRYATTQTKIRNHTALYIVVVRAHHNTTQPLRCAYIKTLLLYIDLWDANPGGGSSVRW